MKNKDYIFNSVGVNKIVEEMYRDSEFSCGLSEVVRVCCGNKYYSDYGKKELDYVKEVMRDFCKIEVDFDLENEVMMVLYCV